MAQEATRYAQRSSSIARQLTETLRRIYHNSWTQYTLIMMHPCMYEFGRIASIEMYDALRKANRNGVTMLHASDGANGVFIRTTPRERAYITTHTAPAPSLTLQANPAQSELPNQPIDRKQTSPKTWNTPDEIVWVTIRFLAIYRPNGTE